MTVAAQPTYSRLSASQYRCGLACGVLAALAGRLIVKMRWCAAVSYTCRMFGSSLQRGLTHRVLKLLLLSVCRVPHRAHVLVCHGHHIVACDSESPAPAQMQHRPWC